MSRASIVVLLLSASSVCAAQTVPAVPLQLESLHGQSRGQCLEVPIAFSPDGNYAMQSKCRIANVQKFEFRRQQDCGHLIVNSQTGRCLDVEFVSTKVGALIEDWPCHGGKNQVWDLATVDNGHGGAFGIIQNRGSKLCLWMANGVVYQGAPCNLPDWIGPSWFFNASAKSTR